MSELTKEERENLRETASKSHHPKNEYIFTPKAILDALDTIDALEAERDHLRKRLKLAEASIESIAAGKSKPMDYRAALEVLERRGEPVDGPKDTQPTVRIIARCPITGAYERDDNQTIINLDPGDYVRLRFNGEVLRFEDVTPSEPWHASCDECGWLHKDVYSDPFPCRCGNEISRGGES